MMTTSQASGSPSLIPLDNKSRLLDLLKATGVTLHVERNKDGIPELLTWNQAPGFPAPRSSIELAFSTSDNPGKVERPSFQRDYHGGTKDGIYPKSSNCWVTSELFSDLSEDLRNENSEVRKLSSLSVRRGFVFVDISDFSSYKSGEQLLVIKSLIPSVNNLEHWVDPRAREARNALESCLCIGDGYIYVLKDTGQTLFFCAFLACLLEHAGSILKREVPIKFHFRMGAHVGDVCCFWDILDSSGNGRWNYIGDGINGGQRILASMGKETDDVAFVSSEVREEIISNKPGLTTVERDMWLKNLTTMGRKKDKHNRDWRVYQVNHIGIAGEAIPGLFRPQNG